MQSSDTQQWNNWQDHLSQQPKFPESPTRLPKIKLNGSPNRSQRRLISKIQDEEDKLRILSQNLTKPQLATSNFLKITPNLKISAKTRKSLIEKNLRNAIRRFNRQLNQLSNMHLSPTLQYFLNNFRNSSLCTLSKNLPSTFLRLYIIRNLTATLRQTSLFISGRQKLYRFGTLNKLRRLLNLYETQGACWTRVIKPRLRQQYLDRYGKNIDAGLLLRILQAHPLDLNNSISTVLIIANHMIDTACIDLSTLTPKEEWEFCFTLAANVNETVTIQNLKIHFLDDSDYIGAILGASKTLDDALTKFNIKGSAAYDATEAYQKDLAKNLFNTALLVKYPCSDVEFQCIIEAIPSRICVRKQDPHIKRTSHPHLKVFADELNDQILNLDLSHSRIVVIGPKFDKKEADNWKTAHSVHYCLEPNNKNNDPFRNRSSQKALAIQIKTLREQYKLLNETYTMNKKILSDGACTSEKFQDTLTMTKNIIPEMRDLEESIIDKEEKIRVLENDTNYTSLCTYGGENCPHRNDTIVAFDSLYDIDLTQFFIRCDHTDTKEVYATLILPFGLKHVNSYTSPELNVIFSKYDEGFTMTHMADMTNGYCHSNRTIMDLMYQGYIKTPDNNYWYYEIMDSIGEMCLLKFVPSKIPKVMIRKDLPPKFDKNVIVYNPKLFFSKIPKYEKMLLDSAKLSSIIQFVERYDKPKGIISDAYTHVQSLFKNVVIGSTKIQQGGDVSDDEIDAYVFCGLIEGSMRRTELGQSFYRANHGGIYIASRAFDYIKEKFHSHFPALVDFFTKTKVERFMMAKVECRTLQLFTDPRKAIVSKIADFFLNYMNTSTDKLDYELKDLKPTDFIYLWNKKLLDQVFYAQSSKDTQQIKKLKATRKLFDQIVDKYETKFMNNNEKFCEIMDELNLLNEEYEKFDASFVGLTQPTVEETLDTYSEISTSNTALSSEVLSILQDTISNESYLKSKLATLESLKTKANEEKRKEDLKEKFRTRGAMPTAWCALEALRTSGIPADDFKEFIKESRKESAITDTFVQTQELVQYLTSHHLPFNISVRTQNGEYNAGSSSDDENEEVHKLVNEYNVHWIGYPKQKRGQTTTMQAADYYQFNSTFKPTRQPATIPIDDDEFERTNFQNRKLRKSKTDHTISKNQTISEIENSLKQRHPNMSNNETFITPRPIAKEIAKIIASYVNDKTMTITDHCTGTGIFANMFLKEKFTNVKTNDITQRPSSLNKAIEYTQMDLTLQQPPSTNISFANPPFGRDQNYRSAAEIIKANIFNCATDYYGMLVPRTTAHYWIKVANTRGFSLLKKKTFLYDLPKQYSYQTKSNKQIEVEFFFMKKDLETKVNEDIKPTNPVSSHKDIEVTDWLSCAKRFNLSRIQDKTVICKKELEKLIKKFTTPGDFQAPKISNKEAKEALLSLKAIYFMESSNNTVDRIFDLKSQILTKIDQALEKVNDFDFNKRKIKVINGFAGAGKTHYITHNFDPIKDAYIAPFADLLSKVHDDLKAAFPSDKCVVKTYEKIAEIHQVGRRLFVDEASAYAYEYLVLLMLTFDYDEILFIGDTNQTKYYDVTGSCSSKCFSDFVDDENIEVMRFTMRFGPKLAPLMNEIFEYPVISLSNIDTEISINDLDELNDRSIGTNICCSERVQKDHSYYLNSLKTAKSTQGRTYETVNIFGGKSELEAMISHRSNGIVAFTRCSDKLNIYIDHEAKKSKLVGKLTNFAINYESLFGIIIHDKLDF